MTKNNLCLAILFGASNLFFYLVTVVGWHLIPNRIWGLYTLSDGAWSVWHATSIFEWGKPFDLSPYSFLQGLGSLYPPNTPWLNPGALALSLPGELATRYYLSYSIYFFELLISTIILGRSLGLSRVRSTVFAQLLCLIIFPPYSGYFVTLPYISLGPSYAHLISMFMLLLVAFNALGRTGTRNNILILFAMLAAIASAVYTAAVTFTTLVPVYAIFGVAILTHEPNPKSMSWKLGTIVGLLLLSYILGFREYYVGTAQVSSSDLLTPGISATVGIKTLLLDLIQKLKVYNWCYWPQAFICSDYPIVFFHAAAYTGAVVSIIISRGLERRLAIAMVLFIVALYIWPVAASAGLLGKLSRISPHYFHFAAYPFYAYFVVFVAVQLIRCLKFVYERLFSPSLGVPLCWLVREWKKVRNTTVPAARIRNGFASCLDRSAQLLRRSVSAGAWISLLAVPVASIAMYSTDQLRLNAIRMNWPPNPIAVIKHLISSDLVEKDGQTILKVNDKKYLVLPGLTGYVEHVSSIGNLTKFTGWAIDEEAKSPSETIAVYIGTQIWATAISGAVRTDVAAMNPNYLRSGFEVLADSEHIPPWYREEVRAFAIMKNGTARELNYSDGYPFSTKPHPRNFFPKADIDQPIENTITATLEREVGLKHGGAFKGFVTTYFGGPEGKLREKLGYGRESPFNPEMYFDSRFYMQAVYGNSFMTTDLWRLNIPTLNEYGQWITKPFYVFAKEMLASNRDTLALHEINVFRLNLKALQALGVRFVITDAELDDPRLHLRVTLRSDPGTAAVRPEIANFAKLQGAILSPPRLSAYLYEVEGSNLGSFSPTKVQIAASAVDILSKLRDERFDFRVHVVLNEQIPDSTYSAVLESNMTVHRGKLRVKARSDGRSLLLLPIQFSRCLSIDSHFQNASPRLLRANLIQSVVLFERELDADISFVFGPGRNVNCRHADIDDYKKLDLARWNSDYFMTILPH